MQNHNTGERHYIGHAQKRKQPLICGDVNTGSDGVLTAICKFNGEL